MNGKGRPFVLVIGNDRSLTAAKTSRQLVCALERIGFHAIFRDTKIIRWAIGAAETAGATRREAYETAVAAKWNKFVLDYGIDLVLSLDLHWLFSKQAFLDDERVKQIHSIWVDDLRSNLAVSPTFPLNGVPIRELIGAGKVTHHVCGASRAGELKLLGIDRVRRTRLAAGDDLLRHEQPCRRLDRLAFTGDPGRSAHPTSEALAAMDRGDDLAALRILARREILDDLANDERGALWLRENRQVRDLLAAAMELRTARPFAAAVSLLAEAGQAFPAAHDFLRRENFLLDAAATVREVNRYDRPALVHRFWKRGDLDVFGSAEEWKPYGIPAQPAASFSELGSHYRSYPAHLNAPDGTRDVTANEELFEIAASGRVSLNLASPEVRECYGKNDIVLAESEDELEEAARQILRDPAEALAMGENARQRTAREHLWEHRLREVVA
jgi:hypothetical protein